MVERTDMSGFSRCPDCGSLNCIEPDGVDSAVCPHCGVIYEMKDLDMCPICHKGYYGINNGNYVHNFRDAEVGERTNFFMFSRDGEATLFIPTEVCTPDTEASPNGQTDKVGEGQ